MNIVQEFLLIASKIFGSDNEISFEKNLPILFSRSSTVLRFKGYRDNYVICSNFDDPSSVYQLYSFLKKKHDWTYIFLHKGFESIHRNEYKTLIKAHANIITSYGDVVTSGVRNNNLEYLFNEVDNQTYSYTKKTQLVLKFYFLNKRRSYTVREIANKVGISPASVARANETLFHLGALEKKGFGAGIEYILKNKREVLRQLKNEFLRPFESSSLILINKNEEYLLDKWCLSGQSALSEFTGLLSASNVATTYALPEEAYKAFQDNRKDLDIDIDAKIICIQSFIYDPLIFSNNRCIDSFDMYLTMLFEEDLNDPRIHEAFKIIERKLLNV